MKNLLFIVTMLVLFSFTTQAQFCDAQVDSIITAGTYTGEYVLDANKVYKITGKVYIGNAVPGNGAKLTIPAGTLIFGDIISNSALVITRGAQGFFLGTAVAPIVMTSCFAPGQRNPGDWGGLVILGPALNNQGTEIIEGGFNPVLGEHGGTDDTFNSGTYQYVRVEFSGISFTTDDEINGITLGSVGSGTTMDHCQVSYSGDDGFEWFGGSVNSKYLISYKALDDDFDTDHGFRGKVQYGVSYRDKNLADVSKSGAFESDNAKNDEYATPTTAVIFSNITAIGPKKTVSDTDFDPDFYHGVHQRSGSLQNIYNSAFSGWNDGMIRLDGTRVNGATIIGGAAIDTVIHSHIIYAGTNRGSSTDLSLTQWNTWYNTPAFNNDSLLQSLDLDLIDQFNDANPNLTPNVTSPLAGSGTDPSAIDPFFESNNFRGAFAPVGYADDFTGRWDLGWVNYNPQATPYSVDVTITNVITLTGTLGTRSAVFGRAPDATDGIDVSLGEVALPPLPPAAEIDIRWDIPGTPNESILDYRSDDNTAVSNPITYTLRLQFGSNATGPQILTWDSDNLSGGSYTLTDGLGGIFFADVDMRTQNQLAITNLSLTMVVIEVDYDFSGSVTVSAGWNLVGAMGNYPAGNDISNWWSGKDPAASVFKYNTLCEGTAGYEVITSMTVGEGAWLKNSTAQTYNSGDEWTDLWYAVNNPIDICSGWNLVSGLDYVAKVSELGTVPNNLIISAVFGYIINSGYRAVVTIDPGKGYWIKSSANGQLIIPGPLTGTSPKLAIAEEDWGKITLTDNAGNSYILYSASIGVDLDYYELPPPPPAGVFDVRFGSQRFVENLSSGKNSIDFSGVEYPVKIKVEAISLELQDVSGKIINTVLHPGEEVVVYDNSINKLMVLSSNATPTEYTLEQNYPNPFNPITTIKYGIPKAEKVELTIFNVLGEKIVTLFNQEQEAGYYTIEWNGKNASSGVYIYTIQAGNYVETKKMVLLK